MPHVGKKSAGDCEMFKGNQIVVKGSKFPLKLYTDHAALLSTLKSENAHGRISRWQLALSEYDLNIYYIPGKELLIADGISRFTGPPSYTMPEDHESVDMMAFVAEDENGASH